MMLGIFAKTFAPAPLGDVLQRLDILAAACQPMGTRLISLCSGTCDPDDQWRFHPDNNSPEAWRALTVRYAVAD